MASETPPPADRAPVVWPDGGQIARQIAILAVALLVWTGLFWGAMRIPATTDRSAAAEARRDARRAAAAADTTPSDSARVVAGLDGIEGIDGASAADEVTPAERSASPAPAESPPTVADPPAPDPTPTAVEPAPDPAPDPTPPAPRVADPAPTPPPSDVPMEELVLDPIDEAAAADEDLGEVSFAADVFPILERRCIKCHGGLRDDGTQRLEEGLSLLTVDDILAGSTWGTVVEPGDVAGSYLYELVESGDMPDNEPRLLPRELRLIAAWIRQGASSN